MYQSTRRIVYGLDEQGRSAFVIDDVRPINCPDAQVIWQCKTYPAENSSNADTGGKPFDPGIMQDREGSSFNIFSLEPDNRGAAPHLYAVDNVGYIGILQGRVELHSDTGMVEVTAGDAVVVRGVAHAVRAVGDEPAIMMVVFVPALPLKAGDAA